jgi:hypothetical protein
MKTPGYLKLTDGGKGNSELLGVIRETKVGGNRHVKGIAFGQISNEFSVELEVCFHKV